MTDYKDEKNSISLNNKITKITKLSHDFGELSGINSACLLSGYNV